MSCIGPKQLRFRLAFIVKVIAVVPSPKYKIPPHALNGATPHDNELALVEAVIEHCAFVFKKFNAVNINNNSKLFFISLILKG